MTSIQIDDEVMARLKGMAEPFVDTPNDVLRRVLGLDSSADETISGLGGGNTPLPRPIKRYRNRKRGDLMTLIEAGLLQVDDILVYKKRTGEEYLGVVTNDGWITVNDEPYFSPSGALKSAVGYDVNGWKLWTVVRTGKALDYYREKQ